MKISTNGFIFFMTGRITWQNTRFAAILGEPTSQPRLVGSR